MKTLALDHILVEQSPGETRAVAIATDGRPWRLFWQRWGGIREPVRYDQIIQARVRAKDASGNIFLDHIGVSLWRGGYEALFMDKAHAANYHEGGTLNCRVTCAARHDHAAKVIPCDPEIPVSESSAALEMWKKSLLIGSMSPLRTLSGGSEMLSSAFEDALAGTLTLPSGGAIHIERTRALTAIDVDSAGRAGKGSAGARALSLNRDAVIETVRQLSLRSLGGATVIDCIGPLNRSAGDKLKAEFIETYQRVADGGFEVIPPSRLGLLQAALPWRETPWDEVADTAETKLLTALREAQCELEAETGRFYTLALCPLAYDAYLVRKTVVDKIIQDWFHGRLMVEKGLSGQEGLKRR